MTSITKNVYINKLVDIVNENNNKYRSTIKMKPVDKKSGTYFDCDVEKVAKILNLTINNPKDPKLVTMG